MSDKMLLVTQTEFQSAKERVSKRKDLVKSNKDGFIASELADSPTINC